MPLKIYTTPTCPHSEKAKKFFKRKKIPFEEVSLFKNETARFEVIELSGQLATPLIVANDEVIIGFDELTFPNIKKEGQKGR